MNNTRWMMNRAGLLNFWYYDEEVFHFEKGKLLLRGSNGSGKSVTMQSFLPVLLDGKKSPDRLDPFGSKARRMEDYLLGEKEVVDRDERTGYLFMEYKKQGTEQYITTGIGMQAKRNKGIKSWYFLLTDNRRIGHDFQLAQQHTGEKIPLSAKELENRIGQGGYVVHSQREYMELVNKYVFGFQSIDAYEDLIKLLIQLRSPKLSKDFKPTVIYEILESALPPLTDDELRHLSETIESMDQTQQQLEQLQREAESITRLESAYDTYNKYILAERTLQWEKALQKSKNAEAKMNEYNTQKQQLEQDIVRLRVELGRSQQQKQVAEQESHSLQQHEVWSLERKRTEKVEESSAAEKEILSLTKRIEDVNRKLRDELQKKQAAEDELFRYAEKEKELLGELLIDSDASGFLQHNVNVADFNRTKENGFDFTVWQKEAKGHLALIAELEKLAVESERLGQEQNRLQRNSSEKKKELDSLQKDLDHYQNWFEEEHQKLENDVFLWIENHPKLSYPNELRQEIARALQGLYDNNRFEVVRSQLFTAIQAYEAEVRKEEALTKDRIEQKEKAITEAEAELFRIKTQKMVEPARSSGTMEQRGKLSEEGVRFLPFYSAVEFQEHVTEQEKERLEAALMRTGILDSLLTDEPVSPMEDAILMPEPRLMGYTLADYLVPDLEDDSSLTPEFVDQVLRSIPLQADGSGFHIDADGTYSIGCLVGHAPIEGPSKYIGRTSRKRHQRELIQQWMETIQELNEELADLKQELAILGSELVSIEMWKREMPEDAVLMDIHEQILNKQHQLKNERIMLSRIDEEWKLVYDKYTEVKRTIRDKGMQLNISMTLEDLGDALTAAQSYIDFLHELKNNDVKVFAAKKHLQTNVQRIAELEEDLDVLNGERGRKESQRDKILALMESIDQQLQLKGIDEVRNRIREVQRVLNETEEAIDRVRSALPQKESDLERNEEKLADSQKDLFFWKQMSEEWGKMVEEEKRRNFFPFDETEEFGNILEKHERSKLSELLTKVFINEQVHLTEYRMFEYTEDAEIPLWFAEPQADKYEPFINEWQQLKGRRLIQMEYRGQRVSPYYVSAELKKELEEQQGWLDEQDRKLYEDIILNSVGIILRNRIQRAQQWVKEMDKIMANRDNSSGLIFSIAWKPLTAESEQELDTKDLVQLLQRNSKFLNEEDLQRITKHFQSRIGKAKELIQLRNEGSTLHQVLKEVLDYRKWFTFVLSFSRVNEPKRELSNNAFFKFSGGEKAMAMYIPLFTAAYSRYKEAGDMAPFIISLDEAFAGVDENNIRDMFEVVEQLGFNYIMNSQALWGDYDTISSLAICELVRPKNADYVTVIRYQWDGKQKSLVFEESIEEMMINE